MGVQTFGFKAVIARQTFARLIAVVLVACSFTAARAAEVGANAGSNAAPDALVKSTVDDVLGVIKQTKDKRALRELAEQKVLPHFDFKRMTQLAVGRAWRDASPDQQKALEASFRTLLVNTYTSALSTTATGSEKVEVKPARVPAGQNEAIVRTTVTDANRQVIPVDYKLEKESEGWKVTDVVVDNLSLVTNYRSTFASEIARSGIPGLIKVLEEKNRTVAKG